MLTLAYREGAEAGKRHISAQRARPKAIEGCSSNILYFPQHAQRGGSVWYMEGWAKRWYDCRKDRLGS